MNGKPSTYNQAVLGLSLLSLTGILVYYKTVTSKVIHQDNHGDVYSMDIAENANVLPVDSSRAERSAEHVGHNTADIVNAQRFEGTLLILAGSPSDFVYPYTKRFDNSTDKMSMVHRRFYFGMRGYDKKLPTSKMLDECPYDCQFTIDTSRFAEADVVLMHADGGVTRKGDVYVRRARPEQMFTYFYYEQPHHYTSRHLRFYNQRIGFNWTLHYQRDATFFMPYGWTKKRREPLELENINHAENKTRKAVWVVSRCGTEKFQKRESYVAELIKHMDIDVLGLCAGNSTTKEKLSFDMLLKQYKFVISFENADCDDYISEKFFRNIQSGVIPIVLGRRAHYSLLAPPYSYIQADTFDSPKHLAAYLHLLDKKDDLYNKYFEWRRDFITQNKPSPICEVCREMREIYYKPSQIDMLEYLGVNRRCWLYTNTQLEDWREKVENVSFPDPWSTIHKYNSRGKPLRFT